MMWKAVQRLGRTSRIVGLQLEMSILPLSACNSPCVAESSVRRAIAEA